MRVILDPLPTRELAPLFKAIFHFVQRRGRLEAFQYFKEGYLVPMDGTGHFASSKIDCSECCVKKTDGDNPHFYHQMLGICIVKPGIKEALFGKALKSRHSKIKLWEVIRNHFTTFAIDSWCQFLKVIAYMRSKDKKRTVTHIRSLIPDTS